LNILGIIPARFASTRFPGKPLVIIRGKPMIRHVYERATHGTFLNKLIIATDDDRVALAAKSFDAEVMMTSSKHTSGTERCAEVIQKLHHAFDAVVNIQGDEPFIHHEQIDQVCLSLQEEGSTIVTLKKRIESNEDLWNENVVKVVNDDANVALYFSRAVIPFLRSTPQQHWLSKQAHFKHIGIYGYKTETLLRIVNLPVHPLEHLEALEQLRWLANGFKIKVNETFFESSAVDTPNDLGKFL
jgi:3-deoxy-manno-octulosonate cytidylyltransferase (CMP-KDO synthetase)